MSWNPNADQGQDPNSQYGQYGGYNPNVQPPPPQPTDPYSGQQGSYGQYGQPGGYNPQAGQQGSYGQQYDQQSGYNPQAGQAGNYGQQPGQQGGYQQYGQQGGYQQSSYQYQPPFSTGAPPSAGAAASGPTSMGMQPNIAAGLSYVLGWITGLIFFFVEKQNRFVRFHAMQSILFFGGLLVLNIILSALSNFIPFVGLLSYLVGLVGVVGYIVLLINGFQGNYFKLPVVGDYAEKYANQGM